MNFGKRSRHKMAIALLLGFGSMALIAGCSSTPPPQPPPHAQGGLPADPVLGVADTGTRCTIPAMMELWRERSEGAHGDYPLGPGDEIVISVPEIDELQNQHMRVGQDGTISMPLVGTVDVGGVDETQARDMIQQRLSKFMKDPRLEMYVDRYRSRGVAVAGAVQKPGVYDLASFGDSLDDMLAMAGGLTNTSAQHAIFLPAGISEGEAAAVSAAPDAAPGLTPISVPSNGHDAAGASDTLNRRITIVIPFGRDGDTGCLNMPARPGDVIVIPAAGAVTVEGWVQNPGSFPINPGMTVLGAVTAAGGALFSWHAEVMRTDENGSRVVKEFSLTDLQNGTETDIPVESGDVVLVQKSALGAIPYGLYEIFNKIGGGIGVGAGF
jgi:polysaccharide biosynthesis/export protein